MGHGYKGGAETHRGISSNLENLKREYPYNNGYFGMPGNGGSSTNRHLESSDPIAQAHDFYNTAAYGGIEELLGNGKGIKTSMEDGTVLTLREVSHSDGTPAVDISIRRSMNTGGVKQQKIHFVQKGVGK